MNEFELLVASECEWCHSHDDDNNNNDDDNNDDGDDFCLA